MLAASHGSYPVSVGVLIRTESCSTQHLYGARNNFEKVIMGGRGYNIKQILRNWTIRNEIRIHCTGWIIVGGTKVTTLYVSYPLERSIAQIQGLINGNKSKGWIPKNMTTNDCQLHLIPQIWQTFRFHFVNIFENVERSRNFLSQNLQYKITRYDNVTFITKKTNHVLYVATLKIT